MAYAVSSRSTSKFPLGSKALLGYSSEAYGSLTTLRSSRCVSTVQLSRPGLPFTLRRHPAVNDLVNHLTMVRRRVSPMPVFLRDTNWVLTSPSMPTRTLTPLLATGRPPTPSLSCWELVGTWFAAACKSLKSVPVRVLSTLTYRPTTPPRSLALPSRAKGMVRFVWRHPSALRARVCSSTCGTHYALLRRRAASRRSSGSTLNGAAATLIRPGSSRFRPCQLLTVMSSFRSDAGGSSTPTLLWIRLGPVGSSFSWST